LSQPITANWLHEKFSRTSLYWGVSSQDAAVGTSVGSQVGTVVGVVVGVAVGVKVVTVKVGAAVGAAVRTPQVPQLSRQFARIAAVSAAPRLKFASWSQPSTPNCRQPKSHAGLTNPGVSTQGVAVGARVGVAVGAAVSRGQVPQLSLQLAWTATCHVLWSHRQFLARRSYPSVVVATRVFVSYPSPPHAV